MLLLVLAYFVARIQAVQMSRRFGRHHPAVAKRGPSPRVHNGQLPRSAGWSAHERSDEPAAAEEDQEGEDSNAKDADDAVLSGHEAHAPGVDEQTGAEHDDARPEATRSERRNRHRGERTPERDGRGRLPRWPSRRCRREDGRRRRPPAGPALRV
jgi:hypothetical protein